MLDTLFTRRASAAFAAAVLTILTFQHVIVAPPAPVAAARTVVA